MANKECSVITAMVISAIVFLGLRMLQQLVPYEEKQKENMICYFRINFGMNLRHQYHQNSLAF